ncbi:unnamed protein product [Rotaria socialis]|uniref:Uncharacterized protein n=2 Tax=Rotaria socialis TaxID=392032 RepID=A0A820T6W5_9BILA|nr:unnamed protein product [Rotaria socialis]CAF4467424.1 unnamed protein product [Rotaria socialis]CAF4524435.1 unnamed protein product [Rotaria socialis]CAF4782899.1 unnamed protein product [Rotaria socialis]
MVEEDIEELYKLTGEDFYTSIEEQYGKNVGKILRYHDIDSYCILGEARENQLLDLFEKFNDENSSDELIALKKEICNFIDEKVSVKIGTKGKIILLLQSAHKIVRTKKAKILSEKRSNRLNKHRSPSSTNNSSNSDIDVKEFCTSIGRSIIKLLTNLNNTIHGVVLTNVSLNDFIIDVKFTDDDNAPYGLVQCICGDKVRLYYRKNGFQVSNFSKHLKSTHNKSTFMTNKQIQPADDPQFSNNMVLGDEELEKSESSTNYDSGNGHVSMNSDNSLDGASVTRKETSPRQQQYAPEYSNDDDSDSSVIETNNLHNRRQSSRVLNKPDENRSSNSFKNQSRLKKFTTADETSRPSSLPPNIRSIKASGKQKQTNSSFSDQKKRKITDSNKSVEANSSVQNKKTINTQNVYNKISNTDFLSAVLETIDINSHRPSNNYKYPQCVLRFATAISILAGRYVYEYLRINLRYVLPSIQTIQNNWSYKPYLEAEFRFNESEIHLNSMQCQYIFVSEDCSAIIPRIEYDSNLDTFNGFVTPLLDGVPSENAFKCSLFEQLEDLFETTPQANLVNIHVIQPILDSDVNVLPAATVLSAYGTDHKITAIDILKRWLMIYKQFNSKGIRVLGFSTDGDPKYLRAMRLAANYFVKNQILNIYNDKLSFTVKIPSGWTIWFFLSPSQLFLFMQDGAHVCTKIRNRMLSKTTELTMGHYEVSIQHLYDLIRSKNKIDHNLSISDLNVKDKQNFSSCQKISDDKILNLLMLDDKCKATYNYLLMLNLLISAYTERRVSFNDRIYYASIVLFYTRMWRIWLYITKPPRKQLNTHYLIYVYLLIEQRILPQSIAENIYLFSSQPCENVFRNARALSGVYSTRINFTISQFLKRINKLYVLTELKQFEATNSEQKIFFPVHHKIKQFLTETNSQTSCNIIDLNTNNLEKLIFQAYEVAQEMAISVGMSNTLIKNNRFTIEQSSELAKHLLQANSLTESEILDVDGSTDDESTDDDSSNYDEESTDITYNDDILENDDLSPTTSFENLQSTIYSGLRLTKSVSSSHVHKYFAVNIHGEKLFLHKQTATWYLQEKQLRLSCDRLQRVQGKIAS